MQVDLGSAIAGVGVATSVIDDYIGELARLGTLTTRLTMKRTVGSTVLDITVLLDRPRFEMAASSTAAPYTRLVLTGTIEARREGTPPDSTPIATFALDAKAKLGLVHVADVADPGSTEPPSPLPVVGLEYQGADGTPATPVTAADLDAAFADQAIADLLAGVRIDLAGPLVLGLNKTVFPDEATRPDPSAWPVSLQLMPGAPATGAGVGPEVATVDAFACLVGLPGTSAEPALKQSFVAERTGLGIACSRTFLDQMLEAGAAGRRGKEVDDATITDLTMAMTDDAISVDGRGFRAVTALPDVDFTFRGPMVPSLVRGTTVMAFDTSGIVVDVDDSDELFFDIFKWFVTALAGVLLFTGLGSATLIGIGLWLTVVQKAWNGDTEIDNAPNTIRDGLANALGASLAKLSDALDDDTDVGSLRVDATPDSLVVVTGNMVFLAQILVVPISAKMRSAEYSKKLRRFGIFELEDGRRFRAQELARLMRAGKVTVPGFHEVRGDYLRADPDDVEANNLLRRFKANPTAETVVRNVRR
ncbi:MAG: hypothetical protein HYX34_02765 [Actinobacteria bacterium]|nr:hypothetical protein [Actinomycetota bacterium]